MMNQEKSRKMKKQKKELTSEQLYRKNKSLAKVYAILSPLSWYLFLVLTLVFCIFAFENSVGNVVNILDKLDTKKYSGNEIEQNYLALVEEWGELQIGTGRISARYVHIGNALFSGMLKLYVTLASSSLCAAVILGKIVFKSLAKMYKNRNEEMVDLATLKSATQIDNLTKSRKEWF